MEPIYSYSIHHQKILTNPHDLYSLLEDQTGYRFLILCDMVNVRDLFYREVINWLDTDPIYREQYKAYHASFMIEFNDHHLQFCMFDRRDSWRGASVHYVFLYLTDLDNKIGSIQYVIDRS